MSPYVKESNLKVAIYEWVIISSYWNQLLHQRNKTMQIQSKKVVQATAQNFEDFKQTSSLLVVDFSANWFSACKMMEPILHEVASDFAGIATGLLAKKLQFRSWF